MHTSIYIIKDDEKGRGKLKPVNKKLCPHNKRKSENCSSKIKNHYILSNLSYNATSPVYE